jgi:hypothetical protein
MTPMMTEPGARADQSVAPDPAPKQSVARLYWAADVAPMGSVAVVKDVSCVRIGFTV